MKRDSLEFIDSLKFQVKLVKSIQTWLSPWKWKLLLLGAAVDYYHNGVLKGDSFSM